MSQQSRNRMIELAGNVGSTVGGFNPLLGAAAALGFGGAGYILGNAMSQPNNKSGTVDQFSDEDLVTEFRRRQKVGEGSNLALDQMGDGRSPLNPNSDVNQQNRNLVQNDLNDLENRTMRLGTYNLDNQLKKASFDNQYNAAENMLNRYVQMRQIGASVINNAASQRY